MDAIPQCIVTWDITWYGIWYHHLTLYIMRYHTGSPQNARQKQLQRKPTTLLRPKVCVGSFFLHSSCRFSRLAFFDVLLLPIRWTHHRTDRTVSKYEHCPLTTRPATWVYDCFCSIYCLPSFRLFSLLAIYIAWYRSKYPNNVLDIDIDTYRKYENIAWHTEKPRYNPELILVSTPRVFLIWEWFLYRMPSLVFISPEIRWSILSHVFSLYWGNTTARIASWRGSEFGFRVDNPSVLCTAWLLYLY